MDWIEVSLTVDGEGAEAVADALHDLVHQGVVIEQAFPGEAWSDEPLPPGPLLVRGYFADDGQAAARRRRIAEVLGYLHMMYERIPEPEFRQVREADWAEAWKKHYHPIRVGERILIKPAWIETEIGPDDIVLEMDPGMAFGTGTHPTTQLCLQACEWFVQPGMTVADVGSGSGVLAIAAAKLGASHVLACDNDEVAVRVAQENAERNGVADRITVQHSSLAGMHSSGRVYDLGLANLTARIIERIAPDEFQKLIHPGDRFIFSGIIDTQADEIIALLASYGMETIAQHHSGDWVLLITRRREL